MNPLLAELESLIPDLYGPAPDRRRQAEERRNALYAELRHSMATAKHPPKTEMKFGTSGWRGILLDDFTVENVCCVTQGLVDTLLDPKQHDALGVADNADLRRRGCVLAHDTRIMGPEFADAAARVLLKHDIPVISIGMATTPEVSTAIAETKAAFSINFTPSHNPFQYHGYKFNPSDGGPATRPLTAPVAKRANEILLGSRKFEAVSDADLAGAKRDPRRYRTADPIALYRASLAKRLPWFSLERLVQRINASDLEIFADNGFGATRTKYEALLAGVAPGRLHVVNGGEDYLFGGKSREPSVENFRTLQAAMKSCRAQHVVGFMNDGDGDRFVGGGRQAVLVMNRFGPMVVRHLVMSRGVSGDVTRSVMTSHMAEAALRRYLPNGSLHETPVGFQHMKDFIGPSVNSWEESDGMSPQGWSRDKDGLLAALLLVDMVLETGLCAEQLLAATEAELGTFIFERRKVSGKKQGDALSQAIAARFGSITPGQEIEISGTSQRVAKVVRIDGTKVVFDDGAWFGVRASGTEPVSRPYVEVAIAPGATQDEAEAARARHAKIVDWLCAELAAATS